MQNGQHTHSVSVNTGDFNTRKFTLSVEALNQEDALQKLSEAINAVRESGLQFKESVVTVSGVTANYFYPYRPHCGMIGPYWDE